MPTYVQLRRFCRIGLVMASIVLAVVTIASAASPTASSPSLRQVLLRPSQVGPGYVLRVMQGGRAVQGQVTLDMCGFHFGTENLRTGRLQAVYLRRGRTLGLSNEVVRYRRGTARYAMVEVEQAIRTCPGHPVPSTVQGVPDLTYRIVRLASAGKRLLPHAIVMKITVSGTVKGKKMAETTFVVYQQRRDLLSGVYTFGGTLSSRRALAFAASAQSARNLAQQR